MPLKAHIDGRSVISVDVDDETWEEYKRTLRNDEKGIKLYCCDNTVYLRKSKLGTKHFVHRRKHICGWEPESYDHLKAKELIYKLCRAEGWEAEPEYRIDDCIADVYATDGETNVAFEIQLSPQTEKETFYRHDKYKLHGLKCVWFFKKIPRTLISNPELPVFQLVKEENAYFVLVNGNKLKLRTAVEKLLRREIKFRKEYTYKDNQIADVYTFEMRCWKCGKQTSVVYIFSYYLFRCKSSDNTMDLSNEDIAGKIASLQKQGHDVLQNIGQFKKRMSKAGNRAKWSNNCRWCGSLIGNHYLHKEFINHFRYEPEPAMHVVFNTDISGLSRKLSPHWCLGGDEGYC